MYHRIAANLRRENVIRAMRLWNDEHVKKHVKNADWTKCGFSQTTRGFTVVRNVY